MTVLEAGKKRVEASKVTKIFEAKNDDILLARPILLVCS